MIIFMYIQQNMKQISVKTSIELVLLDKMFSALKSHMPHLFITYFYFFKS